MPRLIAASVVLLAVACQRSRPSTAGTRLSVSDSAAIVAITAGSGFELTGLSLTSYPDVPFRIGAALLQRDSIARLVVAAIDARGMHTAYDAQIVVAGCGDPPPEIPSVGRLRLGKRMLLRVEIRRHEFGCLGAPTTDFRTVHLLDTDHDFREVLAYQTDSLDYGNAEEGAVGPVAFRHTYDYPDVCADNGCEVLAAVSISSERAVGPRMHRWVWNRDSTALIPDTR
jgi:hypothetical protein